MLDIFEKESLERSLEAAYLAVKVLSHNTDMKRIAEFLKADSETIALTEKLIDSIERLESTSVFDFSAEVRANYIVNIEDSIGSKVSKQIKDR